MEKEVKPYYEDDYQSLDEVDTVDLLEMKERKPYTFIRATTERTISQNYIRIKAGGLVRVSVQDVVSTN